MNTGKSLITVRSTVSLVMTFVMMISLFCMSSPAVAATEMLNQKINLTDFAKDGLSSVVGDYDGDGKYLEVSVAPNVKLSPVTTVTVTGLDTTGIYELTAWMKNDTALNSAYLTATVTNPDDNTKVVEYRDASFMKTVHTEWTKYTVTGICPTVDGKINVGMWVNNTTLADGSANTDTTFVACVDAVTITRVPATYTINEKALTNTRTNYGTPPTNLPSTYVTGASDDQDGNGNYARLNATYHTGRNGYVIFPVNAYGTTVGDPAKTYTGKFWYRSSGTVAGNIAFNTDYKATISAAAVSQWTEATVTGVVPRASDGAFFIGAWLTKNTADATLDLWVDVDHITLTEEIAPYSKTIDLGGLEKTLTTASAKVQEGTDADGDGSYLKIAIPQSGSATAGNYTYVSKYAALDPTKTYTLGGWFKTSKAGTNLGNFWVNCGEGYATKGDAYTLYSGANNYNDGLTTEWKYYEIKHIVPSSAGDFKMGYWARAYAASQQYVYIDGLTLYEEVDASSLVTEAPTAVKDVLPTSTMLGASVRGDDEIRFGIEMSVKGWEEGTVVEEVKYGTLFIPTATLGDAELTLATANALDVPTRLWQENMEGYEGRNIYTCVLTDVPSADTAITARGYMLYRIGDTWYVQYTDAASRTINGVYEAVNS